MIEFLKNALKWLAINFGSKHPYLSTGCAMVLGGVVWFVFFKSVAANFAETPVTSPNVTQQAIDPSCGNIVVTGGVVTCEAGKEKPSEPSKGTNAHTPKDPH
jgi:hypothetical protein